MNYTFKCAQKWKKKAKQILACDFSFFYTQIPVTGKQIYTDGEEKVTQSTVSSKFDLYVKMADVPSLRFIHLKAICVHVLSSE